MHSSILCTGTLPVLCTVSPCFSTGWSPHDYRGSLHHHRLQKGHPHSKQSGVWTAIWENGRSAYILVWYYQTIINLMGNLYIINRYCVFSTKKTCMFVRFLNVECICWFMSTTNKFYGNIIFILHCKFINMWSGILYFHLF